MSVDISAGIVRVVRGMTPFFTCQRRRGARKGGCVALFHRSRLLFIVVCDLLVKWKLWRRGVGDGPDMTILDFWDNVIRLIVLEDNE